MRDAWHCYGLAKLRTAWSRGGEAGLGCVVHGMAAAKRISEEHGEAKQWQGEAFLRFASLGIAMALRLTRYGIRGRMSVSSINVFAL